MAEDAVEPAVPSGLSAGKLENGLSYYVWNHPEPRGYCELRLCVAVGSWFEDDGESGLAHFVEHMAFKTTERFPEERAVVRFLESKGAQYGHDLNASTSLFDTTFRFQLPLREPGSLEDGLDVLAEWAFGIRATEVDVESERPVILEEWRMKRGPKERLKAKYWSEAVDARVASRFPIGDLSVIKRVASTEVKLFYKRWYRPDRMAIVLTGDLEGHDTVGAVAYLKKRFGNAMILAEPSSAHIPPPIPKPGLLTCLLQDDEVTASSVSIELLHPLILSQDSAHLEREVTRRLFTTILDRRFSSLIRQGGATGACPSCILDLAVGSRPLLPTLLCTSVSATVSTEKGTLESTVLSALTVLCRELTRVAKHGITEGEVVRASTSWKPAFSADRPVTSAELAEECLQHFRLDKRVKLMGPRDEAAVCLNFLEQQGRANQAVASLAASFEPGSGSGSWRVCAQCGSGHELDVDALWTAAAAEVAKHPPPAWENSLSSTSDPTSACEEALDFMLQKEVPEPDMINLHGAVDQAASCKVEGGNGLANASCKDEYMFTLHHMPCLDAVEYVLGNGLVAVGLRRDTPGRVALQAFLLGGSTELSEEDECAMGILDDVLLAAGLGEALDGRAMAELQSATQTRVNSQRHLYHRGLGGSTSTGRLELLLKLVAARLRLAGRELRSCNATAAAAVERARARFSEDIRQRHNSPQYELGQRARILSCGGLDVPLLRPVTAQVCEELSLDRCRALHQRAFTASPADFTFVLVGDLPSAKELGMLLAKHLGDLAGGRDAWLPLGRSTPQPLPGGFATGTVKEQLFSKSVEKATVLIIFHVLLPTEDAGQEHLDAVLAVQAACRCGSQRLLSKLRGEAGGVYTVSMTLGRNSLSPHAHITVSFDCDPERQEILSKAVLEELQLLQNAGPSTAEAADVAAALKEVQSRNLKGTSANSYWLFFLLEAYKGERLRIAKGLQGPLDQKRLEATANAASHGYGARVDKLVTAEKLRETFQRCSSLNNYVHLVLQPETDSTEPAPDAKRPRL